MGKRDYLFDINGKRVEIKSFDVTNQQIHSLQAVYKTIKRKPFKRNYLAQIRKQYSYEIIKTSQMNLKS